MGKKKNIFNSNLPDDLKIQCNAIIHSASVAAGGVGTGMAQIPLTDNAVIVPIQVTMIIALGKVFDQEITESAAKAILGGAAASFVGRGISQALVGWIPGFGNVINTATAAGLTETIGWMAADNFFQNNYEEIMRKCNATKTDEAQEEKTESKEEDSVDQLQDLKNRAMEFINGQKNKRSNREEFDQIINDIEKTMQIDDDPELKDIYKRL